MAFKFPAEKAYKLEKSSRYKNFRPRRRLKKAGITEGDRVLDVGSGTGFYTRKTAQVVRRKGYVIGIDILSEMVEKAISLGVPENVEYRKSQESVFPVDDQSVDWVLLNNLYHELESPDDFLREVNRVLKPGGGIYLIDWIPKEESEGPPAVHRVGEDQVVTKFANHNLQNTAREDLGNSHYELIFQKES